MQAEKEDRGFMEEMRWIVCLECGVKTRYKGAKNKIFGGLLNEN